MHNTLPQLAILLLTAYLTLPSCSQPARRADATAARWTRLKTEIRNKYPKVQHLDTAATTSLLAQDGVVIIDVRAAGEYAVSHLEGAVNIPTGQLPDDLQELLGKGRESPILVYCSVGYRSAAAAERLRQAGYARVHNYLGSIFAWADAGRSMVDQSGPTPDVHPYNSNWGQLVRNELHRYEQR